MLVRSTLRLKLGAQFRALDSDAECPLALRPISVAFFLGALEAFGSAFGVRGNRVQFANNVLSRNVALNQRADLGVEIDHLFTWAPAGPARTGRRACAPESTGPPPPRLQGSRLPTSRPQPF